MKKAKKTLKRGFALLCALLCVLPAFSGVAAASQTPVATAVPLGSVHDTASALSAVNAQAASMISAGTLTTAGEARYLSLYAENALAESAPEWVEGSELDLDAERVNRVASQLNPDEFERILEEKMLEQNIEPFGSMRVIAEFQMSTADIVVHIHPDIASVTSVDRILIKTLSYDLSFSPEDLSSDLNETLTLEIRDISETLEPEIEVTMSRENEEEFASLGGFLTLSLPDESGNLTELAMVREVGPEEFEAILSSHNSVTERMDGSINLPGVYKTAPNGKRFERAFTDADKLEGLRLTAAKFVYENGIMDGYQDHTFRPFVNVTRGQFVKIMMNSITDDQTKKPNYKDVTIGAYYYHQAGYAQKYEYMLGYGDGTFRGNERLNKAQICRIMGRMLVRKCKAQKNFPPSNPLDVIRSHYDDADTVPEDARNYVALLLNLGVLQESGRTFNKSITRIDVVEMIYRTFDNHYL